jgi:hypothetical protein
MKSYSSRHRVIARDLATNEVICDLSPDIVTITTNKAYGVAAGTFQISTTWKLTKGKRYDEILKPNDIITIELDKGDGKGLKFVMAGLIDRPAKFNGTREDGAPDRRVKISGRDFGKMLMTTELGWDISGVNLLMFADGLGQIAAAKIGRYLNQATNVQDAVKWLFGLFQEQIPNASYTHYFNLQVNTDDNWKTYKPEFVGLKGTKAWEAMKCMENRPYNTLTTFTDSAGKFTILLEKTPFDAQGKIARDTFISIGEEDIKAEEVGASDNERTNLLCLWPPTYKALANGVLDIALAYPECTQVDQSMVSTNNIYIHGIYPQIIDTVFVPFSFGICQDENPADVANTKERRDLFWNWFQNNHLYRNGFITIHGDPEVMQGMGLIHKEEGNEYFVEQVSHIYNVHPSVSYLTQLQVTRGQKH